MSVPISMYIIFRRIIIVKMSFWDIFSLLCSMFESYPSECECGNIQLLENKMYWRRIKNRRLVKEGETSKLRTLKHFIPQMLSCYHASTVNQFSVKIGFSIGNELIFWMNGTNLNLKEIFRFSFFDGYQNEKIQIFTLSSASSARSSASMTRCSSSESWNKKMYVNIHWPFIGVSINIDRMAFLTVKSTQ